VITILKVKGMANPCIRSVPQSEGQADECQIAYLNPKVRGCASLNSREEPQSEEGMQSQTAGLISKLPGKTPK
jgi:hypothetical protein